MEAHELERVRRSLAMLPPGAKDSVLSREEAMALVSELAEIDGEQFAAGDVRDAVAVPLSGRVVEHHGHRVDDASRTSWRIFWAGSIATETTADVEHAPRVVLRHAAASVTVSIVTSAWTATTGTVSP